METHLETSLRKWEDVFKEEQKQRLDTDINSLCSYGIQPLDDALGCIRRNELVVIGADSGIGKSEIALSIAQTNAMKDKKVCLYFLEGGCYEAMQRMKFRDICEVYFRDYAHRGLMLEYARWVNNEIVDPEGIISRIEAMVLEKYQHEYKNNLFIYDVKKDFSLQDFMFSLYDRHHFVEAPAGNPFSAVGTFDVDLIIIDHLQYFSLAQGEKEIAEITTILREVKQITDQYKIPVVLISHLRKKSRDRGLPDQEDFYGSSNIPKISTTAITISPDFEEDDLSRNIFSTYFRIVKSRVGLRPSFAIKINFDLNKRKYDKRYQLYRVNRLSAVSPDPIPETELPRWAKWKNAK